MDHRKHSIEDLRATYSLHAVADAARRAGMRLEDNELTADQEDVVLAGWVMMRKLFPTLGPHQWFGRN